MYFYQSCSTIEIIENPAFSIFLLLLRTSLISRIRLHFFVLSIVVCSIHFTMGQPRPLFDYFHSFQTTFYRKTNCMFQQDRNSGCHNIRHARWPLDYRHGPKIHFSLKLFQLRLGIEPSGSIDSFIWVRNYMWWWSSGQRARILLRWSEFESRWRLQLFSVEFVFEKNENKQKEVGDVPFK